ncbi:MAG: transglutaminase family protein [Acidimicrobiales bacterium]|nr:transglutaminase family protein [Acidimicrobiales bacterium]HRW38591.1 transglutaminase-like domain-containing protein [Aquihabitans sp.]
MTALERFAELVVAPRPSLGEGGLLIAAHLGHPMPVEEGLDRLDALAAGTLLASGGEAPVPLDEVVEHLFSTVGFRGDRATYGDARNSLLPEVLRRRVGIPITLSVVLLEVADRVGAPAVGVGMPGHFLVGDAVRGDRWFDCFDGGALLDLAGARARFEALHGREVRFDPALLAPTPSPQILARVLNNLANAHRATGDPRALVRVLELRDAIPGVRAAPRARVELAEALAGVGRVADAAAVLAELRERVDPRRRGALEVRLAALRAALN